MKNFIFIFSTTFLVLSCEPSNNSVDELRKEIEMLKINNQNLTNQINQDNSLSVQSGDNLNSSEYGIESVSEASTAVEKTKKETNKSASKKNKKSKASTSSSNYDYDLWSIPHEICSSNGEFWVSKGKKTAFCSGCLEEHYLRWPGTVDILTGKPTVYVLLETEGSSTSRHLREQGW